MFKVGDKVVYCGSDYEIISTEEYFDYLQEQKLKGFKIGYENLEELRNAMIKYKILAIKNSKGRALNAHLKHLICYHVYNSPLYKVMCED